MERSTRLSIKPFHRPNQHASLTSRASPGDFIVKKKSKTKHRRLNKAHQRIRKKSESKAGTKKSKKDAKHRHIRTRHVKRGKQRAMLRALTDIKAELAERRRQDKLKHDQNGSEEKQSLNGSECSGDSGDDTVSSSLGRIEFEERQRPVPKCTILHYSPFKAVWDWIVLLLVLYTAVFTPLIVAFLVNETDTLMKLNEDQETRLKNAAYKTTDPLVIIDLLVDLMFIADIIINFRTTYVHGGEVISNSKKIAIHYLKGWFVIDAIAAVPFDLLLFGSGTSDTLTFTGILKILRLLRLLRVVRRADQYSQYATATLLLMLITFALIAHWLACIFYVVACVEKKTTLDQPISWLDSLAVTMNMPYVNNDTTSGPDLQSRYITAMYFTMTTLTSIGFGNVAPNTNGEKIFSIFAMTIGALMSAVIFGNFSSIMMRMSQGTEEMQQKTKSIGDFIEFHSISGSLSKRIHDAFMHSWSNTNGVDMNGVLKSFPEQIQADICLHLNKNLLNNNQAFKGASPGCLRALSLRFTTTHAPPGDNLIHLGDIVNSIYFIARGSIEILKDDTCMAILGRGDIFGISVDDLSSVVKSNYSVHALTFCDINKIEAYDLQDIFDMYPEFTENFKRKFSLTFNLKMGEYKALVTPQDMDEETIKLIRQKRPKLQCKPNTPTMSALPSSGADIHPALHRQSTYEDSPASKTITELTPSGLHTSRKSYEPGARQLKKQGSTEQNDQHAQNGTEQQPQQKSADEKPSFRSLLLMAAKIQKQKDAEAADINLVKDQPSSQDGGKIQRHVSIDSKFIKKSDFDEQERLQAISDRIDECMLAARRMEQHWDTSIQAILRHLGHEPNVERRSYV